MRCDIKRLSSAEKDFSEKLDALLRPDAAREGDVEARVKGIVEDVRKRGDAAVAEYTKKFDKLAVGHIGELRVSAAECQGALEKLDEKSRAALEYAAGRIGDYHRKQNEHLREQWQWEEPGGLRFEQQARPLSRVGVYAPGGGAAYASTILMTALPARAAGVAEIFIAMPTPGGARSELALAAAALAGADGMFCIGGAQAIAALAFGTETIPRVDKIVGPGNRYVAAAKQRVYPHVGLDLVAGPSEVLVIADGTSPPEWTVWDLFAQSEHDENARAWLVSPDAGFLQQVEKRLGQLLDELPRREVAAAALAQNGALIKVENLEEAVKLANRIAPEHLGLCVRDPRALLPRIRHAGAVFLGAEVSEVIGDYCAGPSHVLPTSGCARFQSVLSVRDFYRYNSVIGGKIKDGQLLEAAATLARMEGLEAHARAAEARGKKP